MCEFMNKLLKMSFDRYGYDYNFLTSIHKNKYDNKYLFCDEGAMILRLKAIHDSHKKLVIIPDFDMDGISAGAILYGGFSLLGFDVALFIPDVKKGYGFDETDIDAVLSQYPDVSAIITCDVGISCYRAVAYAKSKNLEVFVTDHHPESLTARVDADLIVNPSRRDSDCDFKGVCGAYVAYHLITTYAAAVNNPAIMNIISHLSLFAALGSCGDLMPVIHDTRDVIKKGLVEFNNLLDADDLESYFKCSLEYLPDVFVALFENIKRLHFWLLRSSNIHVGDITDVDFGFTYCPMFNSVKRMHGNMADLYKLLYVRYDWNDETFDMLAGWLWSLNLERKKLVRETFASLIADENQQFAPYIYVTDCIPGVCGLLAMKLMQFTGLPCFTVTDCGDNFVGSGRLPEWFDRDILNYDTVKLDGHANAFGVSIPKNICMDYFRYLERIIPETMKAYFESIAGAKDSRPVICINGHNCYNGEYDLSIVKPIDYDLCFDYAYEIEKFRPFGRGFIEPEHILKFTKADIEKIRTMGATGDHLRVELPFNIKMVYFGGTSCCFDKLDKCKDPNQIFAFSGRFSINEYNGSQNLQFMVSDFIE